MLSNSKLFTDEPPIILIVNHIHSSPNILFDGFSKTRKKNFKSWKMSFNIDLRKQTQEVIFLCKSQKQNRPPLCFDKFVFKQVTSQKYLRLLIDTKLDFF